MKIREYLMIQIIQIFVSETDRGESVFCNVVCAHQFHPNEDLIVSASRDGIVKVWGISNKQLLNKPF